MGMRIWHQSMTVLDVLPAYRARIQAHAKKIVHADTEVVVHGLAIDTYPSDYPGGDITFNGAVNSDNLDLYQEIFADRLNPNGCGIKGRGLCGIY